mmetsp:Transcript_138374/g.385981  ORF Transcript_138374/g.385981 Transcript_138374/m.385981 type:complete len:282 (+) Transcript_138374:477-1322(+)
MPFLTLSQTTAYKEATPLRAPKEVSRSSQIHHQSGLGSSSSGPPWVYTSSDRTDQYPSCSISGCRRTNSSQSIPCFAISGQLDANVGPPRSPQKVMSNTSLMFWKCSGSHVLRSRRKYEYGGPQISGLGCRSIRSAGSVPFGQNQVRMWPASGSHSAAKVPPPSALKASPMVASGPCWEQPWFSHWPAAATWQSSAGSPCCPAFQSTEGPPPELPTPAWLQPGLVCSVVATREALWTPSMMSNSPHEGQGCSWSSPYIQNAGQRLQPVGTCSTLTTNSPSR